MLIQEEFSSSNSGSLLNLGLQEEELKGAVVLIFANKQVSNGSSSDVLVPVNEEEFVFSCFINICGDKTCSEFP